MKLNKSIKTQQSVNIQEGTCPMALNSALSSTSSFSTSSHGINLRIKNMKIVQNNQYIRKKVNINALYLGNDNKKSPTF